MVFFVAAIATLGLTSCKKDWACECTYNGATLTTTDGYNDLSKKDAEAKCEGKVSVGIISVNTENNCTLRAK